MRAEVSEERERLSRPTRIALDLETPQDRLDIRRRGQALEEGSSQGSPRSKRPLDAQGEIERLLEVLLLEEALEEREQEPDVGRLEARGVGEVLGHEPGEPRPSSGRLVLTS